MSEQEPAREDRERADEARVAAAAQRWRRHSRQVRLLRRVLPIVILALAGGTLTWTVFRTVMSGVERKASETGEIRLENARFRGQDAQGRSFIIGAEGAVRDPETGRFRLIGPAVKLNLGGLKTTEITADGGAYDEVRKTVIVGPNVRISDGGSGFTLTTPEAVVDTTTGVVTGSRGVQARGPLGTINASSYAIHDQGRRIVFSGSGDNKVRGVFNSARSGD